MRLRQPTDFLILEALEETGRNVAANLQSHTGKDSEYINTRLPELQKYGLVTKIGPVEHSGLYEITSQGKTALAYQDQYDEVDDFEAVFDNPAPETIQQSAGPDAAFVRGEDDADSDN